MNEDDLPLVLRALRAIAGAILFVATAAVTAVGVRCHDPLLMCMGIWSFVRTFE